jgi:hypothetical protein
MAADPHTGLKAWGAGVQSFHVRPVANGFMTAHHDGEKVHEVFAPDHAAASALMVRAMNTPFKAAAKPNQGETMRQP